MYLDQILAAQKADEARGIVSICSAHPWVLKAAMLRHAGPLLIEATCNQVNQFGGYTGMTPRDFFAYVTGIAKQTGFPVEQLLLGGDHLGPSVWKNEPAASAMEKSKTLVKNYVQAGFTKIHLDTSMRLGDDPEGILDVELIARRAAMLAKYAEETTEDASHLRYVIGTEVPTPGGAQENKDNVHITTLESACQTIDSTRQAFLHEHLDSAWERVSALVVHPGVEFGDDFVLPYVPHTAAALSKFIESQPMIYEAHSTDYQTWTALREMVRDHFAILKVGPALTYAFREAIFWLAKVEEDLISTDSRSNIVAVLDTVMLERPKHWLAYYHGTEEQTARKRMFSLSDRIRYYWSEPNVQKALNRLLANLSKVDISSALLRNNKAQTVTGIQPQGSFITTEQFISANIQNILNSYEWAVGGLSE
ncbi:MAG: class II D-tagatose-bisphosphate aldolase, non-catalytic subunit [Anaerolineaceae bacterium]